MVEGLVCPERRASQVTGETWFSSNLDVWPFRLFRKFGAASSLMRHATIPSETSVETFGVAVMAVNDGAGCLEFLLA